MLAKKIANFEERLPSPQSELATQTMKDPYVFDFIPFKEDMVERDIEQALVKDVTRLLLELGTGFAFLGNQYHLNVGGDDFYIDLLFYNLNLRCYLLNRCCPLLYFLRRKYCYYPMLYYSLSPCYFPSLHCCLLKNCL